MIKLLCILALLNYLMPLRAFALDPNFDEYSIANSGQKFVQHISGKSSFEKRYKTRLNEEIQQGPNFAGTFRIAAIGCGSGCSLVGLIDCKSGRATNPDILVTSLSDDKVDEALDRIPNLADRLYFKPDSRLLILRGCLNEKKELCGIHEYALDGDKLKKLRFTAPVSPAKRHVK